VGTIETESKDIKQVTIVYTNYKGITSVRNILPIRIFFGGNEWHKEDQWLMEAIDIEKNALRTFAMKDIRTWFRDQE
jgi:predicted DNA-binding transcriptional regulator YafY